MKTEQPRPIFLKDYAPHPFRVLNTELTFELGASQTRVLSKLRIARHPGDKGAARGLTLDGEQLELVKVSLDGEVLSPDRYAVTDQDLTIEDVPAAAEFTLEIETLINPEANKALTGLYRSKNIYCTQCEAQGFRRITYFIDRPDHLSKFKVRIEAAKKEAPVLLSNGNLIESGELKSGRHFAVWEDPFPKPSYLFALIAGDLACVKDTFVTKSNRTIDLRIYVEPGKEDRCGWAMASLKKAMRWDEERFGREYDLDTFMIVAVSDFNMGAMENKGLNVFNDALILARPDTATDADYESIEGVIAHEYFHNWTGNRVTCRDWFQLCLKEGLTVFRDQEFTADVRSKVVTRIKTVRALKRMQFPEDAGPLAHPVRPSSFIEINNFYTSTVYSKGAELCRMLQTMLGRDGFRKGLDLYFQRHDGEAVTVEDFLAAMADANKEDLTSFIAWYNQAGTPELQARLTYSAAAKEARLTLAQSYPPLVNDPDAKRKSVPIPVKLGLIAPSGKDIALKIGGKKVQDGLIVLRTKKEVLTFEGVSERPIPSLLRDFSAPVNLKAALSDRDMLTLMRADSDLFNRWQAGQAFATQHLVALTEAARKAAPLKVNTRFVSALGDVASDEGLDPAFRATFLTLPSEEDVALAIGEDVDPDAIFTAREHLRAAIGKGLRKVLEKVIEDNVPSEPYSPDAESCGKRALRNAALGLLADGGSRFAAAKVKAQAQKAANMTDCMAALSILSRLDDAAFETALQRFHRKWKNEPLVMDKWFRVQATAPKPDIVQKVLELARDPLFSLKNPNRVRALFGAFAHGNQVGFHQASGKGYELVADAIIELDSFNPQIASRLTSAFESWRMFDEKRKQHAQAAVTKILKTKTLSVEVYEMASRIIGVKNSPARDA